MRALLAILLASLCHAQAVPDPAVWDRLVKTYVNSSALVDYPRWKQQGLAALDEYLAQVAKPWPKESASSEKAALINAYNALTVHWILQNYPVESIWQTKHPFTEARHTVNLEKVSLDAIEGRLRKMGDPRIHAVLVCAARSCPPLRREAYAGDRLDAQLDDNLRSWLGNERLNRFTPDQKTARVSEIFKWYKADFIAGAGSVDRLLAQYAPPGKGGFLLAPGAKLEYFTYQWGLNDSAGRGADYGALRFYWDHERNK